MEDINKDENFGVICSFIEKFGNDIDIPEMSFGDLEKDITNLKTISARLRIWLAYLLKKWKNAANVDKLEKFLIKFCDTYCKADAWEVEQVGFPRCKLATKLRIIRNLLNSQFDCNAKLKDLLVQRQTAELRHCPLGKDRDGLNYWCFQDSEYTTYVYVEKWDGEQAVTWERVAHNRAELAELVSKLDAKNTTLRSLDDSKEDNECVEASKTTAARDCVPCVADAEVVNGESGSKEDLVKSECQSTAELKDVPCEFVSDSKTVLKHDIECASSIIKKSAVMDNELVPGECAPVKVKEEISSPQRLACKSESHAEDCCSSEKPVSDSACASNISADCTTESTASVSGVKQEPELLRSTGVSDSTVTASVVHTNDSQVGTDVLESKASVAVNAPEIVTEINERSVPSVGGSGAADTSGHNGCVKHDEANDMDSGISATDEAKVIDEEHCQQEVADTHQQAPEQEPEALGERSLRKRKLSTVVVESPKKRCKSANNKRTKEAASEEGEVAMKQGSESDKENSKAAPPVEEQDEDDVPLIQLRRSARTNKGKRPVSPLVIRNTKTPRGRKQKAAVPPKPEKVVSSDDDNDGEFKPGVQKRKTRSKGQRKQQKLEESIDSEEEFVQQLEEDNEPLVWSSVSLSSSEVDLDSDGDEYRPAGRNAKRAMARSCSVDEPVDDKPCLVCLKLDRPELVLLCDVCNAGYHTTCLQPALLSIPEGEWLCPVCDHNRLVQRLHLKLAELDQWLKDNEKEIRRKERLNFVAVSLANVIPDEVGEVYESESDGEEEEEQRRVQSRKDRDQRRRRRHSSEWESWPSEGSRQSSPSPSPVKQRTRRTRAQVSYRFEDFEHLIDEAIGEEVRQVKEAHTTIPARRVSHGKDIDNILRAEGCEPESDKRAATKKSRKLTKLEFSSENDSDENSEEYKMSSASEEESEAECSSDSGSWTSEVNGRHAKPRFRQQRMGYKKYDNNFVTYSDSEEDNYNMRSSRRARNKQVSYVDTPGDSDAEADKADEETKAKASKKKKRLVVESDSDYMPVDEEEADNENKHKAQSKFSDNHVDNVDRRRRVLSESEDSDANSFASTNVNQISDNVAVPMTKNVRKAKIISDSDSES